MTSKKSTFKPDAIDADGDGIVQEGTEFERPVEPAVEAPAAEAPKPCCYIAADGDSYASIAAAHKPDGVKAFDYAKTLYETNKGKAIRAGVEVCL